MTIAAECPILLAISSVIIILIVLIGALM